MKNDQNTPSKESFDALVERYRREMMRYIPSSTTVSPANVSTGSQTSPPVSPRSISEPAALSDSEPPNNPPANTDFPPPSVNAPEDEIPSICDESLTDTGYLRVSLSTARRSIPLPDGLVTITCHNADGESLYYVLHTDESGLTETVPLPAPPRILSESPGNAHPYALYNIRADREGYRSQYIQNAQVFSGIVSNVPIEMIPIARGETPNETSLPQHSLTEGE